MAQRPSRSCTHVLEPMKLSQIECFVAVSKARHFGRGAESINRSQPPVSRQIRLLEDELGVQLLHRTSTHVELTEAGKIFLQEVELGMAHLQQAVRAARRTAMPQLPSLRISTTASVMLGAFAAFLAKFQREFPDFLFELTTADKTSQIAMLLHKQTDLAVLRSLPDTPGLAATRLIDEPIVAALNSRHALAIYSQIELHQLADHPLIVYRGRSSNSVADTIVAHCARAGFAPSILTETDDMQTAAFTASLKPGVALVAASLQNMHTPNLVFRPVLLRGEPITMPLYLVYREHDASESTAKFVSTAAQHCTG
jgi:DNA-binding transcriptional LysR family regulator